VVRDPPGAHHLGLHKKLNPRRLVNPHPRPEGARLSVVIRYLKESFFSYYWLVM